MIRYLFLVFVALSALLEAAPLLEPNGAPSPPLQRLLELTHIEYDGSLADLIDQTQKGWLRPRGVERWQLTDPPEYNENRQEFMALGAELGFICAVAPSHCYYDYVLWLGAGASEASRRLDSFGWLWQAGWRAGQFSILSGDAPLRECEQVCFPTATRETEMMWQIWLAANLPCDLRAALTAGLRLVDAPKGAKSRADTADTFRVWLTQTPPGEHSVLCLSSQPYVIYQQLIAEETLPGNYRIETIGPAAKPDLQVAVLLDTIARCLYMLLPRQRGLGGNALLLPLRTPNHIDDFADLSGCPANLFSRK